MAFASASAASSAGRSVPSTTRISKSGPRASTVAGESSSAISTIGFATNRILASWVWDRRGAHGRGICHFSAGRAVAPAV